MPTTASHLKVWFSFALLLLSVGLMDAQKADQSSSCPGCHRQRAADSDSENLQIMDNVRRELILEDILAKLSMTKRPKKRNHVVSLPKAIVDQVSSDESNPSDTFYDSHYITGDENHDSQYRHGASRNNQFLGTEKQLYITSERVKNCTSQHPMNCLKFIIPPTMSAGELRSAKLWIYKTNTVKSGKVGRFPTAVYEVVENSSGNKHSQDNSDQDVYTSNPVDRIEEKWIQIDITLKVLSWMSSSRKRIRKLDVVCPTCWRKRNGDSMVRRSDKFRPIMDSLGDKAPLIVVDIGKKVNKRKKRSACKSSGCCLKDFTLNFRDIGWNDWILVPRYINIRQCQGTCSELNRTVSDITRSSAMTYFSRTTMSQLNPCCSASRMSSIDLVHYNHRGFLVGSTIQNMVVEECNCTF